MATDRLDLLEEFAAGDVSDSRFAIETHVASISQGAGDFAQGMRMSKHDTMCLALYKWAQQPEGD